MEEGMKMPGFTADASLYKPRRNYNLGVNRGADGQVVIPQFVEESCYNVCLSYGHWPEECRAMCDPSRKIHSIW